MKTGSQPGRDRAFTFVEMVVVILVATLLIGMLIPMLASAKGKSQRISCVGRLKNIGLSFRIWATANTNRFPMQVLPDFSNPGESPSIASRADLSGYFRILSNELSTPKILICPADTRQEAADFLNFSNDNVSYFLGFDAEKAKPQSLLAGDRNLTIDGVPAPSGLVTVATNSVLGWTRAIHNRQGNVALGDGSVQQLTVPRLQEQIVSLASATNRLLIP